MNLFTFGSEIALDAYFLQIGAPVTVGFRYGHNGGKDFYGSMVATGLTALVLMQFLIHVAVTTSSMPPTGRALPFISAGGTSILFLLASIGILLNISKSSDVY